MEEKLVYLKQQQYNKDVHPEWSDDKISLKSVMDMKAADMANEGGFDASLGDDIMELLIRRTQIWIEDNLPELFERLQDAFKYLFSHMGEWIHQGIEWILEYISDIF